MNPYYQDDRATVLHGDCLELMAAMPDASFDAVVTDPPYGLRFMGAAWDCADIVSATRTRQAQAAMPDDGKAGANGGYRSASTEAGRYDLSANASFGLWCQAWASECLRVLKPGGHLLAFGGSRTWHRLACAVEDAGFEIRDSIAWLYGSGFPKSLRVSRDERYCHCDASVHTSSGTSPAPQHDDHTRTEASEALAAGGAQSAPRAMSAPLDSPDDCRPALGSGDALPHPAGVNDPTSAQPQGCAQARSRSAEPVDGRVGGSSRSPSLAPHNVRPSSQDSGHPSHSLSDGRTHIQASTSPADTSESAHHTPGTSLNPSCLYGTGFPVCGRCHKPNVDGLGTALKPAFEPVVVARKPLVGTVASNVLAHGTGALNIGDCRVGADGGSTIPSGMDRMNAANAAHGYRPAAYQKGTPAAPAPAGRWPANVVLDESQAEALDQQSGTLTSGANPTRRGADKFRDSYGDFKGQAECTPARGTDRGGASRFFYVAKAPQSERPKVNGIAHPTVKPLALMQWLVRLVTPPGGLVLDPFAGSGTTVEAALRERVRITAIEREADYLPLILHRIERHEDAPEPEPSLFDLEQPA